MIPGNPVYLRAESAAEAVQAWLAIWLAGRKSTPWPDVPPPTGSAP